MKTIQRNGEIKRISDETAENFIKSGWTYAPKSLWKELVRNAKNPKPVKPKPDDLTVMPKHATDTSAPQNPVKKKKHTKENKNNEK